MAISAIGLGRKPHGFASAGLLMVLVGHVLMRVIAYGQAHMRHWIRGSINYALAYPVWVYSPARPCASVA